MMVRPGEGYDFEREQLEKNKRQQIIQHMIDAYIANNNINITNITHPPSQPGTIRLIPEDNLDKQAIKHARKQILQDLIDERRALNKTIQKKEQKPLSWTERVFADIALKDNPPSNTSNPRLIPENDLKEQKKKNEDEVILNQLIREFEQLEATKQTTLSYRG